jgi:hypothetical protein
MFLQEGFAQKGNPAKQYKGLFICEYPVPNFINSELYIKNRLFRDSNNKIYSTEIKPISSDYYTKLWGFFCRKEWEIEKLILVPVRVRLGSLEFTNWMERKPNAIPVH